MIRYAARVPSAQGGDALAASRGLGPAVAAIDLDALRANFAQARRLAAGRRVAVAIGREVVPRSEHALRELRDGDRVEILEAVGGG